MSKMGEYREGWHQTSALVDSMKGSGLVPITIIDKLSLCVSYVSAARKRQTETGSPLIEAIPPKEDQIEMRVIPLDASYIMRDFDVELEQLFDDQNKEP